MQIARAAPTITRSNGERRWRRCGLNPTPQVFPVRGPDPPSAAMTGADSVALHASGTSSRHQSDARRRYCDVGGVLGWWFLTGRSRR